MDVSSYVNGTFNFIKKAGLLFVGEINGKWLVSKQRITPEGSTIFSCSGLACNLLCAPMRKRALLYGFGFCLSCPKKVDGKS